MLTKKKRSSHFVQDIMGQVCGKYRWRSSSEIPAAIWFFQPSEKLMLEAGELGQAQQEIDDGGQADKDVGGDKGGAQDVGGEAVHHFHPDFHLRAELIQFPEVQ